MAYTLKRIFVLLVMCLLNSHETKAQLTVDTITKAQYEKRKAELDYSKTKTIYKLKDSKPLVKKESPKFKNNINFGGIQEIIKFILYALCIIFVVFITFTMLKDIRFKNMDSSQKFVLNENFEIDDIETLEIDPILDKALQEENYRFAIRLQFLRVLKQLQESKFIKWKKDKTNKTYVNELSNYKNEFRQVVNIFDKVWYGNISVNLNQYQIVKSIFDNFLILLQK